MMTESQVLAMIAANNTLSTETWGLILAILSVIVTLIISLFNITEKRISSQNSAFKEALQEQTKIHDKINDALVSLNTTLEVTNWRTKALEETCKSMQEEITLFRERLNKSEKLNATSFVAIKNTIRKEIDDSRRISDGRD
jgi:predicted  nucleic acid-binding Zn-ribbon protein